MKQLVLLNHQTLHVLLGCLFIEAHVLCDLGQTQLLVVVEEVQNAHLVCRNHQVVDLVALRQLELENCCSHGKVPLQLTVVVLLLTSVEVSEAVHARLNLLRNRKLEGLVGGPVACGQDLDIEVDRVFTLLAGLPVMVLFCAFLGNLKVIHHAFDAVSHSSSTVNLQFGDDGLLVVHALRLLTEQTLGHEVLEGLDEDVFVREV